MPEPGEAAGERRRAGRRVDLGKVLDDVLVSTPTGPKTLTNSVGMAFVLVPAGKFQMGSPDDELGHHEAGLVGRTGGEGEGAERHRPGPGPAHPVVAAGQDAGPPPPPPGVGEPVRTGRGEPGGGAEPDQAFTATQPHRRRPGPGRPGLKPL